MNRSRMAKMLLCTLSLLPGAACHETKPSAATEIAAFQAEALSACRCEQHGGPGAKTGCWAKFEVAIAKKQTSDGSTMCAPVYEDSRCWTADGKPSSPTNPEHCMTTAYHALLYRGGEALLCTEKEAKAAEQAANSADSPNASQAQRDAADAAMGKIEHGEPYVAAATGTPGCV